MGKISKFDTKKQGDSKSNLWISMDSGDGSARMAEKHTKDDFLVFE